MGGLALICLKRKAKIQSNFLDQISNYLTKQKIITKDVAFSEELIYKAFIYFCNFSNQFPIDEELKGLCLDKPENFDENNSIKEIIDSLKGEGKIYNFASFVELLHIISKKNIIHIVGNILFNLLFPKLIIL